MRIKADDEILRLDFHLLYDGVGTQLQVWGPFGLKRTTLRFDPGRYTTEDREGRIVELNVADLPPEVPASIWAIGSDLGLWLRLVPMGMNRPKVLGHWSQYGVNVAVEASQIIAGEDVCKRLRMTSGTVEVLVLCDRWRFASR